MKTSIKYTWYALYRTLLKLWYTSHLYNCHIIFKKGLKNNQQNIMRVKYQSIITRNWKQKREKTNYSAIWTFENFQLIYVFFLLH